MYTFNVFKVSVTKTIVDCHLPCYFGTGYTISIQTVSRGILWMRSVPYIAKLLAVACNVSGIEISWLSFNLISCVRIPDNCECQHCNNAQFYLQTLILMPYFAVLISHGLKVLMYCYGPTVESQNGCAWSIQRSMHPISEEVVYMDH